VCVGSGFPRPTSRAMIAFRTTHAPQEFAGAARILYAAFVSSRSLLEVARGGGPPEGETGVLPGLDRRLVADTRHKVYVRTSKPLCQPPG